MKDPIRVTTLTRIWKSVRRAVARNEWAVRLLGLSSPEKNPVQPGLILVQIDGLSKIQLERAMAADHMPFLEQLIEKEHYQLHSLYSGLPATTSAVQAELFYGEKCAVPGSGFRDHRTGKPGRMYTNDLAVAVEERLKSQNPGLLKGGSSYCNIFGGGAEESHFCATRLGWDDFFVTINPFRILLVILLHATIFLRTIGLMCLEVFLVLAGMFRGKITGHSIWRELAAIPARVLVVVFLRELGLAGASNDAARGLPIIHLNLLGYDEQSRQRGPSSKYASWTLKGVDRAIRRLWRSAHRSAGREYDVWVFSGNGLGTTQPYQQLFGQPVEQAIIEVIDLCCQETEPSKSQPSLGAIPGTIPSRAAWLGIRGLSKLLAGIPDNDTTTNSHHGQVITAGSLAFIFLLTEESRRERFQVARKLVNEKHVPMVVVSEGTQAAKVITAAGEFDLPQDASQVFGADHPFLSDLPLDLIQLANHPDAGDLLLVGWSHQSNAISFGQQINTNNGPSLEATNGFALLPCDVRLENETRHYIRPLELRNAVGQFIQSNGTGKSLIQRRSTEPDTVRILTYNVHACVGMDGQLAPERIARVISQIGADVICLQELDVNRKRSNHLDQAQEIANLLEMDFHFHPAWHIGGERFGNAILTHFPLQMVRGQGLHQIKENRSKRGALWVEIKLKPGICLQVISAHLSIYPKEQLRQVQELYQQWVQPAESAGPVVLCGDFNARPASAAYRYLASQMRDVETLSQRAKHESTYFSPRPITRLDHIFVTKAAQPVTCQVITTRLAQEASDHLPLIADLSISTEFDSNEHGQ